MNINKIFVPHNTLAPFVSYNILDTEQSFQFGAAQHLWPLKFELTFMNYDGYWYDILYLFYFLLVLYRGLTSY